MKFFRVGGFVRDTLLGLTPNDTDYVVVDSSPAEMLSLGYSQVGVSFPVFLNPESGDEYALARSERSTGPRTGDFTASTDNVSLLDDLARRDLTINSMAIGSNDTIVDPFNGQSDLSAHVLRHTSDAFSEDPLRVLRLARFRATLPGAWTIAHETKVLCCSMWHDLASLTPERIWKELSKVLAANALPTFFETLYELGILEDIFPEIHNMILCREGSKHHREANVFVHTMMMLRTGSFSPRVQLAILLHDIGKPHCYTSYGSSAGHEDYELVNSLMPYWVPGKLRTKLLFLVANHTKIYKTSIMKESKVASLLESYKRDLSLLEDQLILAQADDEGRLCDPGIKKIIEFSSIIYAFKAIGEYSPIKWIYYCGDNKPSGLAIANHVHHKNIQIVREHFIKD